MGGVELRLGMKLLRGDLFGARGQSGNQRGQVDAFNTQRVNGDVWREGLAKSHATVISSFEQALVEQQSGCRLIWEPL